MLAECGWPMPNDFSISFGGPPTFLPVPPSLILSRPKNSRIKTKRFESRLKGFLLVDVVMAFIRSIRTLFAFDCASFFLTIPTDHKKPTFFSEVHKLILGKESPLDERTQMEDIPEMKLDFANLQLKCLTFQSSIEFHVWQILYVLSFASDCRYALTTLFFQNTTKSCSPKPLESSCPSTNLLCLKDLIFLNHVILYHKETRLSRSFFANLQFSDRVLT